jgi:arabinofuranosyltransferase
MLQSNLADGASEQLPLRRRLRIAAAALTLLALALGASALQTGERIMFEGGVELLSASVGAQTYRGGLLPVTLRFRAAGPLPAAYAVFLHGESPSARECRVAVDVRPVVPSTRWQRGQRIDHLMHVVFPAHCPLGDVVIRGGLYDPRRGDRLHVIAPRTAEDSVFVGTSELASMASERSTTRSAAALLRAERLTRLTPWLPWLAAFALAATVTGVWRLAAGDAHAPDKSRWLGPGLLLPALVFVLGVLMVLEFVKDDAYISFRYAHNLVRGQGLVFNAGDRLEGMTNFLWVFVLAPFEALGLDLFQVCEWLGGALGLGCVVLVARFDHWFEGPRRALSELWGALWLASSSSFVLYAKSGLEQPCAALLPVAGAFVLYRARDRWLAGELRAVRAYLGAGLLLGAGCMTRPELHLIPILLSLPLAHDVARARRLGRAELAYAVGVLAVTAPSHLFRLAYYGTLVPNTFYVKTGSDGSVWWHGLNTLQNMLEFNHTGVLIVLAPLAFLARRRWLEKAALAAICVAFLLFYARVGVDEMHWHRLYIPALPFLCVLAGLGTQNLLAWLLQISRGARLAQLALQGVGWAGVAWLAFANLRTTYDAERGFNGHGDLAGTYHPDLGKFLVRHERPGGLVAFQDMGSTPYYAPDLNFLDFFGLVDRTVAHARHDHGLHTFISGDADAQAAYDAEMREYFFTRQPEWAILTVYTPAGQEAAVAAAFQRDPTGGSLGAAYRNNAVQFALWDDVRFRQRYVPVRTWPRSSAYYLALWRRRDLWERTPGEVVLDAPPAALTGATARFAGGLELLGHTLSGEVVERHEAFITTWWRLPGPMPHDLTFFVHMTDNHSQIPADHVPGDWMYPADRWQAGQILEDRILFQLPPEAMAPGEYTVYVGAYLRSSNERLAIVSGANDGQQRVRLGTLHVKPLRPLVHALIPRTEVDTMRAHPERIVHASQQVSLAR